MSDHPLVTSAATGSISTALLWLVKEALAPSTGIPVPAVPHFPLDFECGKGEHPPLNFWVGLAIGLFLWPILEVAVLFKQWLVLSIRGRIELLGQRAKLYRVLA